MIFDKLVGIFSPKKQFQNQVLRQAITQFNYKAAKQSRLNQLATGLGGTADHHVTAADLYTLREISRDLDRNNVIASGILDRGTEACVGTGIPIHVRSGLKSWENDAEKRLQDWWDNDADVRGMVSGWQMEQMAYRAIKTDGDVLCVLLKTGQIQFIESHRILTPSDVKEGCIHGVKVDRTGRPLGYYVADEYSTDTRRLGYSSLSSQKMRYIDQENTLFLINPKRFSQTRGIPAFAQNVQLFEDIDGYLEACIIAAKVSAAFVMTVSTEKGGALGYDNSETKTDGEGSSYREQYVESGNILYLNPGEEAKGISHTQPGPNFDAFMTKLLRFAGLNFGLPLEMVALDFSQTNYSSARAAMLLAQRAALANHEVMTKRFKMRIFKWKLNYFMRSGKLADRAFRLEATPPKYISVDPVKDTTADVLRVQNGLSTLQQVCSEKGLDYSDIIQQRTKEIQEALKSAEKIKTTTGQVVDWRDVIGHPKSFVDTRIMQDEQQQND